MREKIRSNILSFLNTLKYCFQIAWFSSKKYTLFRVMIKIINPFIVMINLYLTKIIIDWLTMYRNINDIYRAIGILLGINLLSILISRLCNYIETMHDDLIECYLNEKILDKTLNGDIELFDNPEHYNKLNFVNQNQYAISSILWRCIDLINAIVSLFSSIYILSSTSKLYLFLMLISIIPISIVNWKYTRIFYELTKNQVDRQREKYYLFNVSISKEYAQDIRLYGFKEVLKNKYNYIWDNLFGERKDKLGKKTCLSVIFESFPEIMSMFITLHIINLIYNKKLSIGDYSLYTGFVAQFNTSIFQLINHIMAIYDNKIKIDSVIEFMNIAYCIEEKNGEHIDHIQSIEFQNVYFKYPNTTSYILKNISFQIKKGEKIAIIGENGSGKSTLIKLLLRFYDVDSGIIFINNKNIINYDIQSLRNCFTSYFQESPNYSFSIRENIALSDWSNKDKSEQIIDSLKMSNGEDIINKINNNIDLSYTRLFSDSGLEFSKGQQQKIALARTFFRKRDILILDEPSSSLDSVSEYKVFSLIRDKMKSSTVIFISHRMTTVSMADYILVLNNGEIVEAGKKEELLSKNGVFSKLYYFQKKKYDLL